MIEFFFGVGTILGVEFALAHAFTWIKGSTKVAAATTAVKSVAQSAPGVIRTELTALETAAEAEAKRVEGFFSSWFSHSNAAVNSTATPVPAVTLTPTPVANVTLTPNTAPAA